MKVSKINIVIQKTVFLAKPNGITKTTLIWDIYIDINLIDITPAFSLKESLSILPVGKKKYQNVNI